MSGSSGFIDQTSNRRHAREQEGFARAIGIADGQSLMCSWGRANSWLGVADFRGKGPDTLPYGQRRAIEWETSPATSPETTVFSWIGTSEVRPLRPSYPYATAKLSVDGTFRLRFVLGWTTPLSTAVDGFKLSFEPRRMVALVESATRGWEQHGIGGIYRLEVPGQHLTAGKPLKLRVEIEEPPKDTESVYFVSPRSDVLSLSLATLRDEVTQLQADLVQVRRSNEMLWAHVYPELFPQTLKGERIIAWQHNLNHYHPPSLTVLRSGDVIISAREGSDHLDANGRTIFIRSKDGGRTWSPPQPIFENPGKDHRSAPIFELPNGDWVATDYRAGNLYNAEGLYTPSQAVGAALWGAWSTDQGKTWHVTKDPISTPIHPFSEAERPIILLPSGRLLVAANFPHLKEDGKSPEWTWQGIGVHSSDDNGRSWKFLATLPVDKRVMGEPALLRTRSGRILCILRTEVQQNKDFTTQGMLMQSISTDEGATWSHPEPTGMSSMSAPGHLLQLQDGRILCSHASRYYPSGIYVTTSSDEGRTWNTDKTRILATDLASDDSAYTTSGQLADGTILTTWYNNLFGKFFIAVMRYRPEDL